MLNKKGLIAFVMLLLMQLNLNSANIDSLKNEANISISYVKIDLINEIADYFLKSNIDSAIYNSNKANREGKCGDLVPMKEGGSHLAYCQTALPTFPVEMIPNFPRHIINPGQVVAQCTDCSSLDNQRSAHSNEEDRV